jgi:hypothetical protein
VRSSELDRNLYAQLDRTCTAGHHPSNDDEPSGANVAAAAISIAPATTPTRTYREYTSEELLVAVAGGDQQAFASLYDRVTPQVLGVALRVLRDRALAEEVAQEVMVEVWRKADRFDPDRGHGVGLDHDPGAPPGRRPRPQRAGLAGP